MIYERKEGTKLNYIANIKIIFDGTSEFYICDISSSAAREVVAEQIEKALKGELRFDDVERYGDSNQEIVFRVR